MLSTLKQNPESKVSKISVSFDFYNVTFKKATTKLTVGTQFFLEPKLSQIVVNNMSVFIFLKSVGFFLYFKN